MTNNNSNMDNSSPATGDNLPARQKTIMERLTSIRSNKQRILDTLREMKQKLGDDEEPDKELMAKMIASYDLLSAQEEDYMKIIQQIVSIRENAAEDVQHEVEKEKQDKDDTNAETKTDVEAKDDVVECAEVDKQSTELDKQQRKGGTEADWKELQSQMISCEENESSELIHTCDSQRDETVKVEEELEKLGSVAGEAIAASVMNEKLMEKLQLHRDKKAALEQLRQKETESQRGAANEALQQVEMARLKVAAEQEQIERKRKTLERLRREAVRRGIKLGPGSASEPDIVVEAPPEPKSVTEAKLRAKLNAKKKQNEQEEAEDNSPPVPENLAPPERIPPIADNEELPSEGLRAEERNETQPAGGASGSAKKKKKGKRAKEQTKERKDAIDASIRAKLAAIKARKQRMREIQSQLLRPVITESEMNETFQKAQERLKNLTAMREHLEELRESGQALPEETVAMLEQQLVEEENATFKNGVEDVVEQRIASDNLEPALDHIEQVVANARDEFERTMIRGGNGNTDEDIAPGYRLSITDSRRLREMQETLNEQKQLLRSLNSHMRRQPITKSDRTACSSLLRQCLLSADPQFLGRFAETVTKLANGEVIPDLDNILQTLLSSADDSFASHMSTDKEEWQSGEGEQAREERNAKSDSPEMVQSVTSTLQRPASNSDIENGREQSLQHQRIEQAKRRLSTSKAKLQKQRTLERVRCFTEDEGSEERNEKELKGLEKDICRIVEGVLPWVKERAEITADETMMHELRDIILQRSSAICFPDGAASDLFEKQLSTIVDDTLSQYYGEKIGADREQLIFDISEVLYNELAFFQLMHNIDSMVEVREGTNTHDEQ